MDRWRRWRSRRPAGRADARRAGVTALALLAVTGRAGGAAGGLVSPGVAAGAGGDPGHGAGPVPGLAGGAWRDQPARTALRKAAYGRPAGQWDPVELGVHQVIGGGPMPAYIRRPHDELLRAVLDPAVPASRLVVVRGGSSTGKTRAAYEAVADRLADWQLDYPLDPGALAARLEAGIPARTVLWLGELRQYADADGGAAVLGRLADLLEGEGHLVITTMWPEQWTAYIAAARAGPGAADPAGTAGRLLERLPELTGSDPAGIDPARGGVIDVPARFTAAELAAAARTGDPVLAEAAAAAAGAGQDGQVTQYLAGVPDLLRPLCRARRRPLRPGGHHRGDGRHPARPRQPAARRAPPGGRGRVPDRPAAHHQHRKLARHRAGLGHRGAQGRGAGPAARPAPVRHRRGRLPGRRLPRPARPPHPPGPARPVLPVGRPHRPRHQRQRPDPPRAGRTRPRPVPPRRSPVDNSGNPGQHRRRPPAHHPPAPGQPRRHHPRRPMGRRATPASTTRRTSPGCCGSWARPGPATRSPPCWPATPPPTPASTTRTPSPACWPTGGLDAAGAQERSPRWPAAPPPTSASTTRAASPGCCARWKRRGRRSRSPRCCTVIPPPTSPSATRTPWPNCWPHWPGWKRRGRRSRSPRWPAAPPPTSPSATRAAWPACWPHWPGWKRRGRRSGHRAGQPGRRPRPPRRPARRGRTAV